MVTEQCNQPSLRVEVGPGTLVWRGLTDQFMKPEVVKVFPYSSVGKESTCNAGDPSSIPKSGRSLGEGIGYPLQYSWASLVVQLVKNLSAMQETWVQSLGLEDPLEEGMENPHGQRGLVGYSPCGHKESDTIKRLSTYTKIKKRSYTKDWEYE